MPADNPRGRAEGHSVLLRSDFHFLAERLQDLGYDLVGPVARDSAIVYDNIQASELPPEGWTDEQGPGRYRAVHGSTGALFAFSIGPLSLRRWLYPSEETLLQIVRDGDRFQVRPETGNGTCYAFLGVRPCDVQSLERLDRALQQDPRYAARRKRMFLVAVACTEPSGSCFCTSAGGAPDAAPGCDLLLTEIPDSEPRFLVATGSEAGKSVMDAIPHRPAVMTDIQAAHAIHQRAHQRMRARSGVLRAADVLPARVEDPRWERLAERCLACTNCTMVCPTCFCTTVEDSTDVTGRTASRTRKWDSCFTQSFSYIHGGSVRQTRASRYRQWLMHKFAWWQEEFGITGCVGCGRCITWCPAGIDITEELDALAGRK